MRHFLDIDGLTKHEVLTLIQKALALKQGWQAPIFPTSTVVQMFYEPSTRTRVSFELAAKRMQMRVIHFDAMQSSEVKGETYQDTVKTLGAMGVDLIVVRHASSDVLREMADVASPGLSIVNAGAGMQAHPTQALLDMMTIYEKNPALETLKIAIVGDIKHSRVAQSFQKIAKICGLGCLALVAPKDWLPETVIYGEPTTSLKEGLEDADVVIALRVQLERFHDHEKTEFPTYYTSYGLTQKALTWARPSVQVMHPGPLNRGIEIESAVADAPYASILEQVKNGIFMRMIVMESLLTSSLKLS